MDLHSINLFVQTNGFKIHTGLTKVFDFSCNPKEGLPVGVVFRSTEDSRFDTKQSEQYTKNGKQVKYMPFNITLHYLGKTIGDNDEYRR